MPLRRLSCRLIIDFSVEVDSITEDAAHDYAKESGDPRAASDPETWAWIGMQRRLLHALVSRPGLLRRHVESEMRVVVSEEGGSGRTTRYVTRRTRATSTQCGRPSGR